MIFARASRPDQQTRWEQLWARTVGPNTFELCCIPFFAYDLALGDVVETAPEADKLDVVQRVVKPSGHYTFHVWFQAPSPEATASVVRRVGELRCELEWSSDRLVAVSCPTSESAQGFADDLEVAERRKELEYETGRST
jgi:hypothetical protein